MRKSGLLLSLIPALALTAAVIGLAVPNKAEPTFATYTNGDAATYYNSIDDTQSGNTLLTALRTLNLSKRQSTVGYSSMGTTPSGQFKYTDYDTSTVQYDSNGQPYGTKISSFYTFTSATSWNREHVWPNSHGGGSGGDAGSPYPDADIHMPRPTISSENSSRGNSFFVEGMNDSSNGWDPYTAGYSELSRGEAARITFYCTLVNSKLILAPNNTTPSGMDSVTGQSFGSGHTMGNLETLIKWNINYPVSQREKNRNEGAEYLQGNRNAFVDHPEYACKIWGNVNNTIKNMCANASWETGPSVSISKSTASLTVDDTTTISATASDSSTITWTSSDTTVVTVSSASAASGTNITLTAIGPGTATITARATINSTVYSATCSVTVSSSGSGGGGSGSTGNTYTIGWGTATGEAGTYTNFTDTSGEVTDILSFSTAKNSSGSNPAYNSTSNELRLYYNSGGDGGSITIIPASDVTITGAVMTASTSPSVKYTVDGGAATSVSASNNIYTVSGIEASSSLMFQNVNTANTQLRIKTIELTYDVAGGDETKSLSSISLNTTNATTVFTVGDSFSYSGLVVTANYSDSTNATVTPTNVSSPDMSTAGEKTITVTYTEGDVTRTATYTITVNAPAKTLSSISISGQTTSLEVGSSFSFGGTVTAHFSDSSSSDVTSSASFSGYNMSVAGEYTVTVSYTYGGTTKTTTYQLSVVSSGGSGGGESDSFSGEYNYSNQGTGSGKTWSLTNCEDASSYWKCPSSSESTSVALIEGIFTDKTITSNVAITINNATYGSGTNPSTNTFQIYNSSACTSQVTASQSGSLATSNTYVNTIYTVSSTNAANFTDDLAIKIIKPGKQIRLKSITVEFDYETASSSTPLESISATVSKTFHVGETISESDITVKGNNNATITGFSFANNNYQFTYSDAASGGSNTSKTFTDAITYETFTCSLTVQVSRVSYESTSSTIYSGSQFSSIGSSYETGLSKTIDGITFAIDGYVYSNTYLSLSSSKTSAPGKVVNSTPYSTGITNVTVSGASPDIQLSVNGTDWVDLASANTSTTNYYYFKLFYKNTTQSNYVNITNFTVTYKAIETLANVANYIMYTDTNGQCTTKFDIAKSYFENMSSANRVEFMTSSDYVISTARERLQAWASYLGKEITYTNGDYVVTNKSVANPIFNVVLNTNSDNNIMLIAIIFTALAVGGIGGYFFIKRKEQD